MGEVELKVLAMTYDSGFLKKGNTSITIYCIDEKTGKMYTVDMHRIVDFERSYFSSSIEAYRDGDISNAGIFPLNGYDCIRVKDDFSNLVDHWNGTDSISTYFENGDTPYCDLYIDFVSVVCPDRHYGWYLGFVQYSVINGVVTSIDIPECVMRAMKIVHRDLVKCMHPVDKLKYLV